MTLPEVARSNISEATELEVAPSDNNNAATPATWGDAIEVPEMVLIAVVEVCQADVILLPGAKISKHLPKFEYDARASVFVVAPTVSAPGARAGE